jgi:type II secretory pathway component PulF
MTQLAFQYRAVDRRGERARGMLRAGSRQEAYRRITASGMKPIRIRAVRRRGGGLHRSVSPKDVAHLTFQLAVLMEARIPIVDGLRSIAEQESNPRLRDVIDDVASSIESGRSVTDAISPHRQLLGDVYVDSIRAAETSGNMTEVLNRLAGMLERRYEVSKNVKGALMYPACVVGALALAMTFLMIFVVPRFATMFADRGIDLPAPTQFVVVVAGLLRAYWYAFLGALIGGIWLFRRACRNAPFRRRVDGWLHRVPLVREILRGLAVSRFAHVFGVTIRSGLSLIDALELSGRAAGRPLLLADVEQMRDQVRVGGRLSDVLATCRYLPAFTRRMLSAGEEAAELSRMCDIVARHYDREVSHLTRNAATVIEPILIVGLAAVLLVIALAIFLPLWDMAALIS